jgi:hypothetical protein
MVAGICAYQNVISWDSIGALYPQKSQPPAKKSQSPFCQNPFKTLKIQGSRSIVPGLWDGSVKKPLIKTRELITVALSGDAVDFKAPAAMN